MDRKNLRVLLIQIRKNTFIKQEEFSAFMRLSNLNPAQIEVWDVFENPEYPLERLEVKDLVLVGGSSDDPDEEVYFTQEKYPFTNNFLSVIRKIRKDNIPFFASCMGFHMAVQALGGEVIIDKENMEKGTYLMQRTQKGKYDKVFSHLTGDFMAISYHKKRAKRLPEGAINLASTEKCPYHAFTFPNSKFYAFQFHPELDKWTLSRWANSYRDKYNISDEDMRKIKDEYHETPESNALLEHFIDVVVLEN